LAVFYRKNRFAVNEAKRLYLHKNTRLGARIPRTCCVHVLLRIKYQTSGVCDANIMSVRITVAVRRKTDTRKTILYINRIERICRIQTLYAIYTHGKKKTRFAVFHNSDGVTHAPLCNNIITCLRTYICLCCRVSV